MSCHVQTEPTRPRIQPMTRIAVGISPGERGGGASALVGLDLVRGGV